MSAGSLLGRPIEPLVAWHHRAVRLPRAPRIAAALARVAGPAAASLLDVGCGDGLVGRELGAMLGATRVVGVDVLPPEAGSALDRAAFDGTHLPFPARSFEVVVLADVLHHAADPRALLAEALRVTSRVVAIKEHVARGWLSRVQLLAMDLAGNAARGVEVRGGYFDPPAFATLALAAGGRIQAMEWPVHVHDRSLRWLAPSELQVVAAVIPASPRSPLPAEPGREVPR